MTSRRPPLSILGVLFASLISLHSSIALAGDEIDPSALHAEKLAETAEAKQAAELYAEAVDLYLEAYKTSPAAVLLFNAARLYDTKLGARGLALDCYRRALAAGDLEEPLANTARARIEVLEKQAQQKAELRGDTAPFPERRWHPLAIAGVATAGAGVLSLGASGILALVAKSKDDEASTFCDGDRCTDARAIELTNDAAGLANAATVTFVIGAVLAAGGVVLWLLAPSRASVVTRSPSFEGVRF